MSYARFALMILVSTLGMFGMMYLNTYALGHVFFSQTRAWMAVMMGAFMAFVMLAFMASMYPSRRVNLAILGSSIVVFVAALGLVRSQITVDGLGYMRAMIPHHSIAIMTSRRAGIEDARVAALAQGIVDAQNREIAEMRALVARLEAGERATSIYRDPEPRPGNLADALGQVLLTTLHPAPMSAPEVAQVIGTAESCAFRRTADEDPVLVAAADDSRAVAKLNNILLDLSPRDGGFGVAGMTMTLATVDDLRADSELVFRLDPGPEVAYRGFWSCGS